VNDIRPVVNDDFLIENPAVWRLFKAISIPLTDISVQNAKMIDGESSDEDIVRHADEWITANSETFEGWVHEANKATRCTALMKRAFGEHAVERWSEICIPD
jgi:glycine betaine/proline transport system substrate-binding protein